MGNLDELNSKAQDRFAQLKQKKWGEAFQVVKESSRRNEIKVDANKLQKMLEESPRIKVEAIEGEADLTLGIESTGFDKINIVTNALKFIDSLELSPNLSIAIGYIIASKTKDKKDNLQSAIEFIKQEI